MANSGLFFTGIIVGVISLPFIFSIWGVLGIIAALFLIGLSMVEILDQWERGVVLTLGKFAYTMAPGLNFAIPLVQRVVRVDLRIQTTDVPKQEIITKDNVPLLVNAVVYFRVERPEDAVMKIQDYPFAVAQYTQAALRDVIGNNELDSVLTERDKIAGAIKANVDKDTSGWGVDITSINIQEIELPAEMKRAMAKQAESERERRAMIIKSEGELSASKNLANAADVLSKASGALHLRTLQTITDIAADPSEKIIILVPSDFAPIAKSLLGKKG